MMRLDKFMAIAADWWLTWAFGLLAGYLTIKIKCIKDKQTVAEKRQAALEEGVQALLRGELIRSYEKYHEQGYITMHGLEAANKAYAAYHELGGNGTITSLIEDMRRLEVET